MLHLRYNIYMNPNYNICLDIDSASFARQIGFLVRDSCKQLCHGFMFEHNLYVLCDNPYKTQLQSSCHLYYTYQEKLVATKLETLQDSVYYDNCVSSLVLSLFQVCSIAFIYNFNMFRLANPLVSLSIYSYRIAMFRKMFRRKMHCKKSKRYTVNQLR